MTRSNDAVDREAAEAALIELLAEGRATRVTLGDDALWRPRERSNHRTGACAEPDVHVRRHC